MKKISAICSLAVLLVLPLSAHSFTKGACKPDAEKFCKAQMPDKAKVEACLAQHMKDLAPACQANLKEKAAQQQAGNTK